MSLYKIFRTKRKLRRKDAQRASTTDLDTSGILAQPFPPMVSRAKSPCDILDFVGYPRMQLRTHMTPPPLPSPIAYYQHHPSTSTEALPLTIRNKTPASDTVSVTPTVTEKVAKPSPSALIIHQSSSSTTTESPRDLSEVLMPAPKKAQPPTWGILNAHRTEKTLVEDKQRNCDDAKQAIMLHQQKISFELERQDWARREEQHRQLEQQMLQMIQENHAKIDQLSSTYSQETLRSSKSCKCTLRHSDPNLRTPHPRPSSIRNNRNNNANHSRDNLEENESDSESEYDAIEGYIQHAVHHAERSNSTTDRFPLYVQPINRHSMYNNNNRLLLDTPINWSHYHPHHHSDHDDDGYASEDDDSSFFENKTFNSNITNRQYRHSHESSDDDDDDEEEEGSLDGSSIHHYWQQSLSQPVYQTNRWSHLQRRYHHPLLGILSYQHHMPMSLSNSTEMNYSYHHQRLSSMYLTNERTRKPLLRHYSYEDVPRHRLAPYH